jgi:hypothetical protein
MDEIVGKDTVHATVVGGAIRYGREAVEIM